MFFENIIFENKVNKNDGIADATTGFNRGNMFDCLYKPYRNYRIPKVVSNSYKSDFLMMIYEYDFALNDLALYLDLHPDDMNVYKLFKMYTEKYDEYVMAYEKKFGPMEVNDSNYSSYMWEKGPWPFTGGKVDV